MRRIIALSACSPLVFALAAGSVGCGTEESPPGDTSPTEWTDPEGQEANWKPDAADHTEWKFKETTSYIKSPKQNLVLVTESTLVLPTAEFQDLLPLVAGDVLIANAADDGSLKNPNGFLRKVVSIAEDGADTVITTEPATLADAFETCDMVASWDLPSFGDLTFVDETDGTTLNPENFGPPTDVELEAAGINFNVGGVVLFNQSGLKATVTKGSFSFTPSFHFELDAAIIGGLKHFEAVATGTTTADLEVKIETTAAIAKDFTKTFGGTPIQIPVGPLTATVTPKLVMGCSVDVPTGSVTAGAKAVSAVSVGAEYDKSTGLKGIAQSNFTLTRNGPDVDLSAVATARCFIRPSLDLNLSAIGLAHAGANLEIEGFGDVAVTAKPKVCTFDATVGVKANIDVELEALGFEIVDKDNLVLIDKSVKLVDNGNCNFLAQF